ncbi:MAG: transcriptional activator [Litorilinea sp.]|nr:MAG: transcriptional activator [Litorilinea sp.]
MDRLSAKAQAILFYLAVMGQAQARTALAPLLWGDMSDSGARMNLRKALASLRQELDPYLQIERQLVDFRPEVTVWVDVLAFEDAAQAGLSTHEPATLQQAVSLYQGDFLTDFYVRNAPDFELWMYRKQTYLRELMVQALQTLVQHYATARILDQGIATVRRLLSLEPWREEAHRQLMQLLAQDGQRSAALRQYERCREILADELGVEPDPETVALYAQIRDGEIQMAASNHQAPAHPAPAQAFPHNLPAQTTPFLGRRQELDEIHSRLQEDDCRLLTLVGPGGIGKTRLALQVAQEMVDRSTAQSRYADGIFFVPLLGAETEDDLIAAIAEAMEIRFHSHSSPRDQLLASLQAKHILLILDSFEHLLEASDLPHTMLVTTPGLTLLVTSRIALNLQEEWFHGVGGMALPPEHAGAEIERYDAAGFFIQCARRARPDFAPVAEADHVARICRLLGGMPLALELAAAWLKALPAAHIAEAIRQDLNMLSARQRNVPERQRSIATVLEQSWQLLTAKEQAALKHLAVFQGGFTPEAAELIAGVSLFTLANLVDKAWLRVDGMGRYDSHELLRRYVREQLANASDQTAPIQDAHARYYATLVASQAVAIHGKDQRVAIHILGADIENIRAAWNWTLAQAAFDIVGQLVDVLAFFYDLKGWYQEWVAMLDAAEARLHGVLPESERHALLAVLHVHQGWVNIRLGHFPRAHQVLTEALAIYQQCGAIPPPGVGTEPRIGLNVLANIRGDYEAAFQLGEEARRLSEERQDTGNLLNAYAVLASTSFAQGDYSTAQEYAWQAYQLAIDIENRWFLAHILNELGQIHQALGQHDEAVQYHRRSLALWKEFDDPEGVAATLSHLATIALEQAQYQAAEDRLHQSLAAYRTVGGLGGQAMVLKRLGQVARARGDYTTACHHLVLALELSAEIGFEALTLAILVEIGHLFLAGGAREQGRQVLSQVLHHPTQDLAARDGALALFQQYEIIPLSAAAVAGQWKLGADLPRIVAELRARFST